MKDIVVFCAGLSSGGAEHQCTNLINFLVERGYNITLTTFYDVEDHYYVDNRVRRVHLAPGKNNISKLLSIFKYFITLKTDVVIAFSQRLSVLSVIPAVISNKKYKMISCERNCTVLEPDIWEKIIKMLRLYKRADYIIPNSHSQKKHLLQQMPFLDGRIIVINNYTDLQQYSPSKLPMNKKVKVGIFCRFEAQKNVLNLIEAVKELCEKGYYNFEIDWYGNHSFNTATQIKYYEECITKINEYKLDQLINIFDPVKNVSELIPTFDVMCLPSLFEGFSNSISEYICCARPVLCSDVSDNSLMVHDGLNGFLFDPNSVSDIANAFEKYFKLSEIQKSEFSAYSRKNAEVLFNKEKFINSYIDIIEN